MDTNYGASVVNSVEDENENDNKWFLVSSRGCKRNEGIKMKFISGDITGGIPDAGIVYAGKRSLVCMVVVIKKCLFFSFRFCAACTGYVTYSFTRVFFCFFCMFELFICFLLSFFSLVSSVFFRLASCCFCVEAYDGWLSPIWSLSVFDGTGGCDGCCFVSQQASAVHVDVECRSVSERIRLTATMVGSC
ncbi:hypothetical protein QVD17_39819 [Tagetes erecta]|uniref:Uncharacterized protein n=1 Tax=Tagetes erecta TaxID=13708 RepID=A0AAD8NFN8_TARER|nr:hypothetical protein QVD17_39819 [Tagetes erecta]